MKGDGGRWRKEKDNRCSKHFQEVGVSRGVAQVTVVPILQLGNCGPESLLVQGHTQNKVKLEFESRATRSQIPCFFHFMTGVFSVLVTSKVQEETDKRKNIAEV